MPTDAMIVQIADAVVNQLNDPEKLNLGAVRSYIPTYEHAKDFNVLRVSVVPREQTLVALSRRDDDFDYMIGVAVQKRVQDTSPVHVDPFMHLAEQIIDEFRGKQLSGFESTSVLCVAVTNTVIFEPSHLDEMKIFSSLINLTFRVARSR